MVHTVCLKFPTKYINSPLLLEPLSPLLAILSNSSGRKVGAENSELPTMLPTTARTLLPLLVVVGLVYLVTYPILLQGIWSYTLHTDISRDLLSAAIGALVVAELALAISFWLIDPPLASVMLSMATYVIMGLFQHEAEGRLFPRTVSEFVGFSTIVFLVVVGTTVARWMK